MLGRPLPNHLLPTHLFAPHPAAGYARALLRWRAAWLPLVRSGLVGLVQGDPATTQAQQHCLGARPDAELGEDVAEMGMHGTYAEIQPAGNVFVWQPARRFA